MDLSKQTIKLYEDCPNCHGIQHPGLAALCKTCHNQGKVGRYVPIADILAASEDILKAAVRQALRTGMRNPFGGGP